MAQADIIGSGVTTPVDVGYLADNIITIRYFEINGAIHQAIAAFKKRSGKHERALRELKLQPGLIQIGKSLAGFLGILTGTPVSVGEQALEPPE